MNAAVQFEVLACAGQQRIGVATLNRPQTLNGLTLEMCELLQAQLTLWENDAAIALVVLAGAGGKAFCAGGDLHGLYKAMQENSGGAWDNAYARRFFEVEYRLDYHIHTYSKPVLCWGSGIVMGGGVGLMMGASHRAATETTRFAMPEITIGLFPDVGGTWMLSRLPRGIGNFLALSGAQLGAGDLRMLGLADYVLPAASWPQLLEQLRAQAWPGERRAADIQLGRVLREAGAGLAAQEPGPLQRHYGAINDTCDGADLDAISAGIAALKASDDPWLQRAAATHGAGSPGSARLCFELLRRTRLLSLADAFRQEYIVSLHCGVEGDFREGIRALLIDKDKSPKWNPAALADATPAWAERFFKQPWPARQAHPLADLG
jgi:enoyl-CoA hydratase/carnithine racemase